MSDILDTDLPLSNEWTILFNPQHIKDTGSHQKIEADEESLKNLARRFDLVSLKDLSAHLVLHEKKNNHSVHVTGDFKATVEQICVITEAPVITEIEDTIEAWFTDPDSIVSLQKARREQAIKNGSELQILEEEDDPEPFINGMIDLGELVAQNISLAIPTYPRAEGASFDGHSTNASVEHEKAFENPFKALENWKKDN